MMNPTQSATDKVLTPRASAEMLGRNISDLVEKGNSLDKVLLTLGEFVAHADDKSVSEANRYLYRWLSGA